MKQLKLPILADRRRKVLKPYILFEYLFYPMLTLFQVLHCPAD